MSSGLPLLTGRCLPGEGDQHRNKLAAAGRLSHTHAQHRGATHVSTRPWAQRRGKPGSARLPVHCDCGYPSLNPPAADMLKQWYSKSAIIINHSYAGARRNTTVCLSSAPSCGQHGRDNDLTRTWPDPDLSAGPRSAVLSRWRGSLYGSGSSVMSRPELKNGVLGRGRARVAPTYMRELWDLSWPLAGRDRLGRPKSFGCMLGNPKLRANRRT